jgi:hypothetical protein
MNTQPADNTSNFTSIDDIIKFYTGALQHSESQKNDLNRDDQTDSAHSNQGV